MFMLSGLENTPLTIIALSQGGIRKAISATASAASAAVARRYAGLTEMVENSQNPAATMK